VAADLPQRLAAILAADIADYTRLMERDEGETVAAWRRARAEVIDPTVALHHGRIVKLTGDGFLAEFTTAESAVKAALDMQAAFAGIFPQDKDHVAFRMGVNLGDIWVDAEDIYGAGVNIAARLEALAEPGGVCVSGAVYDAVKHKIAARYQPLGAQRVKNVADPIQVWRVATSSPDGSTRAPARARRREERRARSRPLWAATSVVLVAVAGIYLWHQATNATVELEKSIAVLPLADLSPQRDQAYFADGISEELLNTLAQVGDLLVVARTSSFVFRDGKEDARSIGQKLNVSYLVEGSVRRANDDLAITVQLIRTDNQSHVFSRTFERELDDILTIQKEIAAEITGVLNIALGAGAFDRPGMTRNVAAVEALMKAMNEPARSPGSAGVVEHINALRGVVQMDPGFGLAWLQLYRAYSGGVSMFPPGEAEEFPELAAQAFATARDVAPDMPELQLIDVDRAIEAGDWVEADRRLTDLLEQQRSNDAGLMARHARFLYQTGRIRDAAPVAQRARRLEPLSQTTLATAVYAHMANEEFDRALQEIESSRDWLSVRDYYAMRFNVPWQQRDTEEYARQWRAYHAGPDYDGSAPAEERFMQKFLELLEAGDVIYARQEVNRLLTSGEFPRGLTANLAGIANHYGDADWQAQLLEAYVSNRTVIADWLPRAALYRETARFRQRMERNGLAHYWRTTGKWPDKCRPQAGSEPDFVCF
jgi:TolB-like protein/class 3 adenylate cyclase